jgi:hypothetical protein
LLSYSHPFSTHQAFCAALVLQAVARVADTCREAAAASYYSPLAAAQAAAAQAAAAQAAAAQAAAAQAAAAQAAAAQVAQQPRQLLAQAAAATRAASPGWRRQPTHEQTMVHS